MRSVSSHTPRFHLPGSLRNSACCSGCSASSSKPASRVPAVVLPDPKIVENSVINSGIEIVPRSSCASSRLLSRSSRGSRRRFS